MPENSAWDKRNNREKFKNGTPYYPHQGHPRRATESQKRYLNQLLDWIEEHDPDNVVLTYPSCDRKLIRRYDYYMVDATSTIRKLCDVAAELGRTRCKEKWFINLVRNKETGETKRVKGHKPKTCPSGYELIGTLKIIYTDWKGDVE